MCDRCSGSRRRLHVLARPLFLVLAAVTAACVASPGTGGPSAEVLLAFGARLAPCALPPADRTGASSTSRLGPAELAVTEPFRAVRAEGGRMFREWETHDGTRITAGVSSGGQFVISGPRNARYSRQGACSLATRRGALPVQLFAFGEAPGDTVFAATCRTT